MDFLYSKVFRKLEKNINSIDLIKYVPGEDDYYGVIKKEVELGRQQVILNSSIMLALVQSLFEKKQLDITDIEFVEYNEAYAKVVDSKINDVNANRHLFLELIEILALFKSKDSIELYKVEMGNQETTLKFKSNGIIIIDKESNNFYTEAIKDCLEEIINGINV